MNQIINKIFDNKSKPILIAEISANHNGSLKKAKKLIQIAKKNGADIVKLQTYEPHNMTINSSKKDFIINSGIWKNYKLWDLYKKAQTPLRWQKELFEFAKKIKIPCFSTPYDDEGVELLKRLNCPMYKISSFEMKDLSLVRKICSIGKPVIISTGLANLKEIKKTYQIAKKAKCKKLALLYCVSVYPASIEHFNLNNIQILKKEFRCPIGFSDHSKDNAIAMLAISQGAKIIEKHIALKNQKKGLDIEFSIKGDEIKKFKDDMIKAWNVLGKKKFFRHKDEYKNKKFQRSIYAVKKIEKGEKFTPSNIKRIRPGYSLSADKWNLMLGKKSSKKYLVGSRLSKNELKK
jgi:pseudaminic acid synthase